MSEYQIPGQFIETSPSDGSFDTEQSIVEARALIAQSMPDDTPISPVATPEVVAVAPLEVVARLCALIIAARKFELEESK